MPAAQLKKSQGRSKHQTEPPLKGCIYFICARGAHTNMFHYSLFAIHYNKVRSKVNSELDLLLDEGDVDAILMGKKTKYPDAAIRLTEQMAQEFISDLFSTLRERMIDLQYCKVVFVGGGAILLKRQIETSGKVGTPFFVPKINANADGYEYLYRIETAGR